MRVQESWRRQVIGEVNFFLSKNPPRSEGEKTRMLTRRKWVLNDYQKESKD